MQEWRSVIVRVDEGASVAQKERARREAQAAAIDKAYVISLQQFPDLEEEKIWALISAAHKLNLADLDRFNLDRMNRMLAYDSAVSAHQSWNRSSGLSFERYISRIQTSEMFSNEIRFELKSKVFDFIKKGKITNHESDLRLIREWADNFDLYALQTIHNEMHIFGCIQVKTSIRDRVGRDDQFSKNAMESNFWVAEAVLNGDFFKNPKYYAMVNGGTITYPENNWHGVYVMAGIESDGRIYKDMTFETMAKHAVIAAKCFTVNRTSLTRSWKAEQYYYES